MSVTLGSQITLVGYDVKYQMSNVKYQTVELVLHWQALRETSESYTVFVHLVDGNGAVRTQKDNMPMNGMYPTTLWQPGEFVSDAYTLSLPPDLPPGEYTLEAGMYLAETGARLPVTGDDDHIVLTKMEIAP
jgi:hypothetical protein